jgi:hypothetical protein
VSPTGLSAGAASVSITPPVGVDLMGYGPVVAQRHFGRPTPFAPEAGEQLIRHALELTAELFEGGPSAR